MSGAIAAVLTVAFLFTLPWLASFLPDRRDSGEGANLGE